MRPTTCNMQHAQRIIRAACNRPCNRPDATRNACNLLAHYTLQRHTGGRAQHATVSAAVGTAVYTATSRPGSAGGEWSGGLILVRRKACVRLRRAARLCRVERMRVVWAWCHLALLSHAVALLQNCTSANSCAPSSLRPNSTSIA
jgi:hypothetical protein